MDNKETFLFDRRKYTVLIAGLIMLAVGFGLMLGGGSENPAEFNPEILVRNAWVLHLGSYLSD